MGPLDADRLAIFVHPVQPIYNIIDGGPSGIDDDRMEDELVCISPEPGLPTERTWHSSSLSPREQVMNAVLAEAVPYEPGQDIARKIHGKCGVVAYRREIRGRPLFPVCRQGRFCIPLALRMRRP